MSQVSNSNTITRNYLDSLLIETRYLNSDNPSTEFNLYGESFASPIMTAALSHLEQLGEGGMARGIALGAKGVCIGRPLMTAYTKGGEDGGCAYLGKARDELAKAMAFTGCVDLSRMDPGVIHRI